MPAVVAFDVHSHASMHLPFNEGYIQILRAAFPASRLLFLADKDHIINLAPRLPADANVEFRPVSRFNVAPGRSAHNPLWGRRAARGTWRQLADALAGEDITFAALLGADANLLSVFRRNWPQRFDAPLHFILHNHLSAALRWRTRNPLFRPFDYRSELSKGLPANQKLVALELGIAGAVEALMPALQGSVLTLEHPVLEQEWTSVDNSGRTGPIKVGFLGHCSPQKGFDVFVELAHRFTGPAMEFHAIGLANPSAASLDVSVLKRAPSPTSVPRDIYVAAVADMDLICLPMNESYNYVASGSVIDAVTAIKPLLVIRNEAYAAMADAYGSFGPMVADRAGLEDYFEGFSAEAFHRQQPRWVEALSRMREARKPEVLARDYPPERCR